MSDQEHVLPPVAAPVSHVTANLDQLALDTADKIMGLFFTPIPGFQLKAKIQEAVHEAILASRPPTKRSPDWMAYHAALSAAAELLDNMQDGDPITDLPKFLAAKLVKQSWIIADPHGVIARLRTATQTLLDAAGQHIGWQDDNAPAQAAEEADKALAAAVGIEDSIQPAGEQSSMAGAAKGGITQGKVSVAPSDSASVDTLKFRARLSDVCAAYNTGTNVVLREQALIAHIDTLIAARVAGVRKDALEVVEHAARICESACVCDNDEDDEDINRILRNRAAQIRALIHSPATGSKE